MGLITLKFLPLRWGLWKCGSRRRVVEIDDTYLPSSGVRPAAAPAAPTWQVPKAQRRRGAGPQGPPSQLYGPSLRPAGRPLGPPPPEGGRGFPAAGPIGRGGEVREAAQRLAGFLLATRGGEGKP